MSEIIKHIKGIENVLQEGAVLRRFGKDHRIDRGIVVNTIKKYHPKRIQYIVTEIRNETQSAKTVRLVPVDGYLPPFQAGQYINVFVDVNGVRTSRPYSISSSPNQHAYYEITVRSVADGFVSDYILNKLSPGDMLESTGPGGSFYFNPILHDKPLVFIAGGCGITPFISMLRYITERGMSSPKITLIYGCANPDDIIFHKELDKLGKNYANFDWHLVVSEPAEGYTGYSGFITGRIMKEILGDLSGKKYLICGPEVMYTFCSGELKKAGLSQGSIRTELQGAPAAPVMLPGWPGEVNDKTFFKVRVNGSKTIEARATETLMNSLERNGFAVEAQCRSGECSMCRTKLISGKVYQPDYVKLRKSDRDFGYIHPCTAFPIEDLDIKF